MGENQIKQLYWYLDKALQELMDIKQFVGKLCQQYVNGAMAYSEGDSYIPATMTQNSPLAICMDVLDYTAGTGKYDFSGLPSHERENLAFHAWQEIEADLRRVVTNHSRSIMRPPRDDANDD